MFERLAKLLSEALQVEKSRITMETNLQNDLDVSSFDIINLICEIEEEFQITIPDRKISSLVTIKDIIAYLEENTAKPATERLRDSAG